MGFGPAPIPAAPPPSRPAPAPVPLPPTTPPPPASEPVPLLKVPLRLVGVIGRLYVVLESDRGLVLLDQHAAHERIIYERLRRQPPPVQDLLFPLAFDVSVGEGARLAERSSALAEAGIVVRRAGAGTWEVTGLAPALVPLPADALVEALRQACGDESSWRDTVLRTAACRLALKEGDPVDAVTAVELVRGALQLDPPRCPHGRPLWHEIGRDRLFRLVDRPV